MMKKSARLPWTLYVFGVKWLGAGSLVFALLLAFALSAGLANGTPPALAILLSVVAFPFCLILLDDRGRPRSLLRPRSFRGAFFGFFLILLLGGTIGVQAVVTLLAIDLPAFLALTGLDSLIDAIPRGTGRRALSPDVKSDAVFFGFAVALVAIPFKYVWLMVLVLRFDDSDLPVPPKTRGAAAPVAIDTPVAPVRVRSPEHDAALRAMRRRMAERQTQTQSLI